MFPSSLPEYMGGRPSGRSRRSRRAAAEWDRQREQQMKEYTLLRNQLESDRAFALQQQQATIQAQQAATSEMRQQLQMQQEMANQKMAAQIYGEASSFIGEINGLDPRSPTFRDDILKLKTKYPLGIRDDTASKIANDYEEANKTYIDAAIRIQSDVSKKQAEAAATISDFYTSGGTPETVLQLTSPDPITGEPSVNINELKIRTGELKGKEAKKKAELESPEAISLKESKQESKEERSRLRSSIISLEDEMATAQSNLETYGPNESGRKKVEAKIKVLNDQIQRRKAELEAIGIPQQPTQPTVPVVAPQPAPTPAQPPKISEPPQTTGQTVGLAAGAKTEQPQQPESEKTNIKLPQGWKTMDLAGKRSFISDVFETKNVNGSGPENDPSGLLNVNIRVDKSGEKSAIEKALRLGYSQKESELSMEGGKFIRFTLDENGKPYEEFYIGVELPEKDKAAAIWAGQNWHDPRSKKIRERLGVE